MSSLRVSALRVLYRVAYRLLTLLALVSGRHGRGVKCVLTHGSEVLLVRHTYGPRELWQLPGGGARRGEDPATVAAREMGEELGLHGLSWRELARLRLRLEHMSSALTCMRAELADPAVRLDPVEIAEARWFAIDRLPERIGLDVRELILTMGLAGLVVHDERNGEEGNKIDQGRHEEMG